MAPNIDAGTVRELLAYWLGAQEERSDLSPSSVRIRTIQCRALVAEIGKVRLDRLDRLTLDGYRDRRIRAGAATRTVAQEFVTFYAAWKWGKEIGMAPNRDIPRVKLAVKTRRDTPAPTRETMRAALGQLQGWQRMALLLLEGTGCRNGEIASLTWEQVDLERLQIRVEGKTGARTIPISAELAKELREFPRENERVLGVRPHTVCAALGGYIHAACDAAGVPRFAPQGVRRAAVAALYRMGVNPGAAGDLMGHSAAVAMKYYLETSEEDRRDSMRASGMGRLAADRPREQARPQRFRRILRFR